MSSSLILEKDFYFLCFLLILIMSIIDMDTQLRVGKGLACGDVQVTFFFSDKPSLGDLVRAANKVFPGVDPDLIKVLPGYCYLIITQGNDFDVPKS